MPYRKYTQKEARNLAKEVVDLRKENMHLKLGWMEDYGPCIYTLRAANAIALESVIDTATWCDRVVVARKSGDQIKFIALPIERGKE